MSSASTRRPSGAATILLLLAALCAGRPQAAGAEPPAGASRAAADTAPRPKRPPPRPTCEGCHGELELLRQHTDSLAAAVALLAPARTVAASAHGEMACGECHTGFGRFPHRATATRGCASCHAEQDTAWSHGVHARQEGDGPVACESCHGVHDVLDAERLAGPAGVRAMNASCVACHATSALAAPDPHADSVGCAGCHGAHDVRTVDQPGSGLLAAAQARTCGACHDSLAVRWREDAHGAGAVAGRRPGDDGTLHADADAEPAACTGCHGGHGATPVADAGFVRATTGRCEGCHGGYATTFADSYHGKAIRLGSGASATCWDCHTAHDVHSASDPRSSIAEAKLVETCGACHDHARPGFVRYDPHPNPRDWDRNWILSLSFYLMNTLLVGVLAVFGTHTVLWWVRLTIDRKRGGGHGNGGHA